MQLYVKHNIYMQLFSSQNPHKLIKANHRHVALLKVQHSQDVETGQWRILKSLHVSASEDSDVKNR